jgi:hypothetical protein
VRSGGQFSTFTLDTKHQTNNKYEALQTVRVSVDAAGVNPVSAVSKRENLSSSRHIELKVYRKHLLPNVIQPWETPCTQPDISGRAFSILACSGLRSKDQLSVTRPVRDAWIMRDEFLNLKHDTEALRRFLNKWGVVNGFQSAIGPVGNRFQQSIQFQLPHLIWKAQMEFRRALVGTRKRWLRSNLLYLTPTGTPPYLSVDAPNCSCAISATITIDRLSGVKFGICKRKDCRRLFEHTTKHTRFYCSWSCAHVVAIRNQYKRERELELKGRDAEHISARKRQS